MILFNKGTLDLWYVGRFKSQTTKSWNAFIFYIPCSNKDLLNENINTNIDSTEICIEQKLHCTDFIHKYTTRIVVLSLVLIKLF